VGGRTRGFEGLGAKTGFAAGAGIQFALGNRWTLNVEYLHINYDASPNGIPIGSENTARAAVSYMF
jgi:opacity protein-like surface antigen